MRSSAAACLVLVGAATACGPADNAERPAGARSSPGADRIVAVGFVVGAPQLVAVSPDQLVVWDTDRAKVTRRLRLDGWSLRLGSLLSPGARQLVFTGSRASGEAPFETRILNVDTGKTSTLAPVGGAIGEFAITEDGTMLLRATRSEHDGVVQTQTWRLPSGERLASGTVEGPDGSVISVALSPTGDRFALGVNRSTGENRNPRGSIGRIYICETATSRVLATLDAPDIPRALMFSADGAQLYWGHNGDAQVHLVDAASGAPVATFGDALDPAVVYGGRGGVARSVQMMAVSATWTHMVTARQGDSTVQIWNPGARALVQTIALTGGRHRSALASMARGLRSEPARARSPFGTSVRLGLRPRRSRSVDRLPTHGPTPQKLARADRREFLGTVVSAQPLKAPVPAAVA